MEVTCGSPLLALSAFNETIVLESSRTIESCNSEINSEWHSQKFQRKSPMLSLTER